MVAAGIERLRWPGTALASATGAAASSVTGSMMLKVVPVGGFGVDLDVTIGLADDPVDGGQPEPGTGAFFFGGKEWPEYMPHYVRGHSAASVTDP